MVDIIAAGMPTNSASQDPLTHFGLDFVDAETGGLIRNKLYLLYGPLTAWKTAIALHFVFEGLRNDQRVTYVTSQDPEAVILQADRLGFNLRPFIHDDRLTLLTFQPRISQQLEQTPDYPRILAELQRLAGPGHVDRVVFDPIESLVGQTNKANILPSTRLLIEALKDMGSTILCTFDESEEPHLQVILKEFVFLSFGAFQLADDGDNRRVFRFQKVIWNPQEYPEIPLTMRSRYGVQVLEPAESNAEKPYLKLASGLPRLERNRAPVQLPRTLKILLVDGDDFYHEMLQDFLGERFKVEPVRDSVEAISRLLESSYDIIIANMNMPRVDGRELCLRIRQHHSTIPLIAFSNKLKRGVDAAGVLRVGADMYISRPLAFNQVKASIEAVLRRPPNAESFTRTLDYIKIVAAEPQILRGIPREDPVSGLATLQFFEKKVRNEIEKATIGEYRFSMAGYQIQPDDPAIDLDPMVWEAFRKHTRRGDLVTLHAPGTYLAFLEECLEPGIRRVNDRLKKAISKASREQPFLFRHAVATFPNDARDYDTLLGVILTNLNATAPKLKRLS